VSLNRLSKTLMYSNQCSGLIGARSQQPEGMPHCARRESQYLLAARLRIPRIITASCSICSRSQTAPTRRASVISACP
jgi:hypothetical protein